MADDLDVSPDFAGGYSLEAAAPLVAKSYGALKTFLWRYADRFPARTVRVGRAKKRRRFLTAGDIKRIRQLSGNGEPVK